MSLLSASLRADSGWIEWQAWGDVRTVDMVISRSTPLLETEPTRWNHLSSFASADDFMDHFIVRMRGYFKAPTSGAYRFKMEVKGSAALRFCAIGDEAAVTVLRTRDGAAESEAIELIAGQRYYLEAIHHGAEGPDSLRVGWVAPDGSAVMPLPAKYFEGISAREEITAFNLRKAYVEPYTQVYDQETGWAQNRHDPRPDQYLTRETFFAAGALLEEGTEAGVAAALRSLRQALPLQNTQEGTFNYGNWPRVKQQPDNFNAQNIGGFIGAEIILILEAHRDVLPEAIREDLEAALRRAAMRGMRYNPPVTATNIVTKAIAVGLLADQMLDMPEVGAWARERLVALHAHTAETGLPSEFNSPTYSGVVRRSLGMLRDLWEDAELRPLVDDLNAASWREIAWNYNPHLGMWTGPSSRRYWDIDTPAAALQLATDNRLFFGVNAYERTSERLPSEFSHYFERTENVRDLRYTVLATEAQAEIISQQSPVPLVATLHHAPEFTLGSFNRGDLWDQRRSIIAHWGRRDAPGVFRLTTPTGRAGLLAAQVNTLQEQNHLVAAVTFATDAGWGHHPWDIFDSAMRTHTEPIEEVRLRFLTAGPSGGGVIAAPDTLDDLVTHDFPGGRLEIRFLAGETGGPEPRWEETSDGLDLVLAFERGATLATLDGAGVAVAVSLITNEADERPGIDAQLSDGTMKLRLGDRRLEVPTQAMSYADLQNVLAAQPAFFISDKPNQATEK